MEITILPKKEMEDLENFNHDLKTQGNLEVGAIDISNVGNEQTKRVSTIQSLDVFIARAKQAADGVIQFEKETF